MLKRIYINNYRCLANFDLFPGRANLVVGANGSGKSTFFEALNGLRSLISGASVRSVFTPDTLPWWNTQAEQSFELEFAHPQTRAVSRYSLRIASKDDGPVIAEESLEWNGTSIIVFKNGQVRLTLPNKPAVDFSYAGHQSVLAAGFAVSAESTAVVSLFQGVACFKLNPWAMSGIGQGEADGLHVDGSNFVSWLRKFALDDPQGFSSWVTRLCAALPQFDSLRLLDSGGSRMLMGVAGPLGPQERHVPFHHFSEGEKCLAVLYAIAARRSRASTLMLDEPSNFVSLRELQPVLRELLGEEGPQLFVVSHHPETINYLAPETTWMFKRRGAEHVRVERVEFDRSKGEQPAVSVQLEMG